MSRIAVCSKLGSNRRKVPIRMAASASWYAQTGSVREGSVHSGWSPASDTRSDISISVLETSHHCYFGRSVTTLQPKGSYRTVRPPKAV